MKKETVQQAKPTLPRDVTEEMLDILSKTYPSAESELDFTNPFECLIATMLSAQCTDLRVNIITEKLFKVIQKPLDVLNLTEEAFQDIIRSCNYYITKSKNIRNTCQQLLDMHDGQVPADRELLMALPGVGRKTANVVLSNAFGIPAIAVDTHVQRVSNRLGIVSAGDPLETERQLMLAIPREQWSAAHHWLILHGRRICRARTPLCVDCPLNHLCREFLLNQNSQKAAFTNKTD
jgi:endonuclease III